MAWVVSTMGCAINSSPGMDRCPSSSLAPQRLPMRRSRYAPDAAAISPINNLFLIEQLLLSRPDRPERLTPMVLHTIAFSLPTIPDADNHPLGNVKCGLHDIITIISFIHTKQSQIRSSSFRKVLTITNTHVILSCYPLVSKETSRCLLIIGL